MVLNKSTAQSFSFSGDGEGGLLGGDKHQLHGGEVADQKTEERQQGERLRKKVRTCDFKAVEESYSSPLTDAVCPEMSPGLEGGYIALGNKVFYLGYHKND